MQSIKLKLQDLKSYIQLVDKRYLGAGVGFGVIIAGVALYSIFKQPQTKKAPSIVRSDEDEPNFGQVYNEAIKAVTQALAKYNGLSNEVIKQIIKSQYKLAEQEYIQLVLKLRKDRRKVINDKHEYSKLILSIDTQIENLMEKHLNAILAHFTIDKTYWIEAVQLWTTQSQENKQQWEALLFDMQHDQLASLRKHDKQALKLKKLLQIIEFKTNCLKTYDQSTLDIDSSSAEDQPDLNAKYTLIDTYISDQVFKKFGVEEEDINYSVQKLNQQDKANYQQKEDKFTDLMRTQIFGNDEEEEQQNAQGQWEDQQNQNEGQGDEEA